MRWESRRSWWRTHRSVRRKRAWQQRINEEGTAERRRIRAESGQRWVDPGGPCGRNEGPSRGNNVRKEWRRWGSQCLVRRVEQTLESTQESSGENLTWNLNATHRKLKMYFKETYFCASSVAYWHEVYTEEWDVTMSYDMFQHYFTSKKCFAIFKWI